MKKNIKILVAVLVVVLLGVATFFTINHYKDVDGFYAPYDELETTNCDYVEINIEEINLSDKSPYIEISWHNARKKEISFGEDFEIYRIENKKLYDCFIDEERYINTILHTLTSNHDTTTFNISGFDITKPGQYLFALEFSANDNSDKNYKAQIEFDIVEENGTIFKATNIAYSTFKDTDFKPTIENAPLYKIEDNKLYKSSKQFYKGYKYSPTQNVFWIELGEMKPVTLTEQNFDNAFTNKYWLLKYSASGFRNSTTEAFEVKRDDSWYLVVKQQDGSYVIVDGSFHKDKNYASTLYISKKENNDTENLNPSFTATVLETEPKLLVSPDAGTIESKSSDKIYVSTSLISNNPIPKLKVGQKIKIVYNGEIAESYPAQIINVFAIYEAE